MSYLFNVYLYNPLLNGLFFLYSTFNDLGISIILLTIIIRFLLYPLFYKSFKNQTLMQKIQPEVQRIQREMKDDKENQAKALMSLYKDNNINPFSSFLLLFVQLPVLIALYRVFLVGINGDLGDILYSFVAHPATLNTVSLGLIDLSKKSMIIVVLAAIVQYWQSSLSFVKNKDQKINPDDVAANIGKNMMYIGPILTVVILGNMPSAVGLYWLTSSLFSVGQQWMINRSLSDKK